MFSPASTCVLAAGKVRLIQRLLEGDVFAWSVLLGFIAILCIVAYVKHVRDKNAAATGSEKRDGGPSREP